METWTIAMDKIGSHAGWKMMAAAGFWLLVKHVMLFSAFAGLVFLDLAAKWLAISAKRAKARGEESDFLSVLLGIPKAWREGRIRASSMKRLGVRKLVVYLILVLSAALIDSLLWATGQAAGAVSLVLSYLAGGEFLSILEHLDEAGVPGLTRLKTGIQKLFAVNKGR